MKKVTFKFIKAERNCTNYDIAIHFEGKHNRKINSTSVNDIAEKIAKNGFIGYITLIKTRAFGKVQIRVADGQHRLEAAKLAGSPFNYELIELVDDTKKSVTNFIAGMNSVGTRWSNLNHLEKQVENGIHEYIVFKNCLETSTLKITDLEYIFLGGAGSKESKEFKSGEMKFSNEKASLEFFESVKRMSEFLPNKAFSRRALYKTLKVVKSPKKLEKLILKTTKLISIENEADLEKELNSLYNKAA